MGLSEILCSAMMPRRRGGGTASVSAGGTASVAAASVAAAS
ncbi:hypothetical protein ES5_15776, partial [Dietzia cinnamea P4]